MLVMFSPRNGRCKSVNSASEWPFPKQLLLLTTSVTSNPSFIRLIKPLWGVTKNGRTHWKSKTNKLTFLWCSRCGFGVFHLQLFSIYSFKWADYRDPNRNWVFCFSFSKKMTNAWSPTEGENTIGLFLFFEPRSRKKNKKKQSGYFLSSTCEDHLLAKEFNIMAFWSNEQMEHRFFFLSSGSMLTAQRSKSSKRVTASEAEQTTV